MNRMLRMPALAVASLLALSPAAWAADQVLRMGVGAQVTSIDPHFHNISPNNAFASMVFDELVGLDAQLRPQPALALSWRPIGEDVWEIRLRPGVTFSNGSPFTADDVAFTFSRIPAVQNSPGSFMTYIQWVRSVEVVDPLTLRLHTDGPFPLVAPNLGSVPILDRETHAGMTTSDFNSGKAAIGTGPFRVTSIRLGDRIELERSEGHWGRRPAWDRVDYRMITNDATRTAALLAGDVDIIDQVPTGDIARLRRDPRVRITEADSLRLMFLVLDQARGVTPFVTGPEGQPLDRNPLQDARVRHALAMAVDRPAIVSRVMEGAATATTQFMPAGTYGYAPDLPVRPVDPEAARRLLAEAGYPQGFRLVLHGSNDRYLNDARIVQAIGQMWSRIGVRTAVEVAPYASFVTRASRQEFSAYMVSWGSSTGEPLTGLRSVLATYDQQRGTGSVNRSRYSNPALDALLGTAARELDDSRREAILQDAARLMVRETAIIPLHVQKNTWASRQGFVHEPRVDERSRAQDVRPAAASE
ncbi:ABC transporter substrate-binding protein [Belnapia sp. T6]|uniref:ABC transporter substrate-binding protein n=1 Tax=Belnapia mucosa TaxID=2804532 RepID=A0ABS1VAT1_9PROT|nr:ABC transporter substrate-binding protein [Belnapia mucosa]MBL6458776.1 ABC transporter substrate-binding protein [Belnapia mucosa]